MQDAAIMLCYVYVIVASAAYLHLFFFRVASGWGRGAGRARGERGVGEWWGVGESEGGRRAGGRKTGRGDGPPQQTS